MPIGRPFSDSQSGSDSERLAGEVEGRGEGEDLALPLVQFAGFLIGSEMADLGLQLAEHGTEIDVDFLEHAEDLPVHQAKLLPAPPGLRAAKLLAVAEARPGQRLKFMFFRFAAHLLDPAQHADGKVRAGHGALCAIKLAIVDAEAARADIMSELRKRVGGALERRLISGWIGLPFGVSPDQAIFSLPGLLVISSI